MSKFGELINENIPVLLAFFIECNDQSTAMHEVLRDVATALGDKVKVIKIDIDKNKELSEALRVKNAPTFIIYKDGELKWRQSGEQDANTLIAIIQDFI